MIRYRNSGQSLPMLNVWSATLLATFLACWSVAVSHAQAVAGRCHAEPYHQLDFWLGHWEVRNTAGGVEGTNTITSEQDGCVVVERWTSPDQTGISLNFYDFRTRLWYQHWVDSFGNTLDLRGGVVDGRMTLTGDRLTPKGEMAKERNVWYVDQQSRLRNVWDYSLDGGKTWILRFDGVYKKLPQLAR